MKNTLVIFLFTIFTISAFSQATSGNEISAEGSAKTKVKPDLANFKITVLKENLVEKTAIKELNEEIEKLQKVLFSLGFTDKNIKIADYQISSNENSDNKKEYSATNSLSINFALDNKLIDAFYQQIQSENMKDLDVTFETQMSEELEKTTRQKLVQMAVLDAKSNAENIAKALDVKISNVKQVSKYNLQSDNRFVTRVAGERISQPMAAMAAGAKTSFNKFEVEEKELQETITIVYEIVKK